MAASQEWLNQLAALLTQSGYTARSREELEREAAAQKQSEYDQKRLSTRQQYEREALALAKELAGIASDYEEERTKSASAYAGGYQQLSRDALKRGMQRSSYNEQTLALLLNEAARAQGAISARQSAAEQEVRGRQTLAENQLGEQLRRYDEQQQADTLAALNTLLRQEQEKQSAALEWRAGQLQQLYQNQVQQEQNAQKQSNWLQEFNAKYGGGTSSGKKAKTASSSASSRSLIRHGIA